MDSKLTVAGPKRGARLRLSSTKLILTIYNHWLKQDDALEASEFTDFHGTCKRA